MQLTGSMKARPCTTVIFGMFADRDDMNQSFGRLHHNASRRHSITNQTPCCEDNTCFHAEPENHESRRACLALFFVFIQTMDLVIATRDLSKRKLQHIS
jgi:hypothetical protein